MTSAPRGSQGSYDQSVVRSYRLSLVLLLAASSNLSAQVATASISGQVLEPSGSGLHPATAELHSTGDPRRVLSVEGDKSGEYQFINVPVGSYSLRLLSRGFEKMVVESIETYPGEQKRIPSITLMVGSVAKCTDDAAFDSLHLLSTQTRYGDFHGSVRVEPPKNATANEPLSDVVVSLISTNGPFYGTEKTDHDGEFRFRGIPSGSYIVRINHPGFYALDKPGYRIQGGFVAIYQPIYMESCADPRCDPKRRPKKPRPTCE